MMTKDKITHALKNKENGVLKNKTLGDVVLGETATVKKIRAAPEIKRRLLDLGIVSGTKIKALYKSPFRDPTAFFIRGTVIALRFEDCQNITVH